MKWLLVVIPVFLCVFLCVDSAITFSGPKCGTNICGVDQFCSKYHKQCENCDTICDSATHNFDNAMCTEQCQDYLHDIRYARSSVYSDDIRRLRFQLNVVTIIMVIILLIVILSNGVFCFRWCRRKGIITTMLRKMHLKKPSETVKVSKNPDDLTHANPHTQSPKVQMRHKNRPQLPTPQHINRESTVFSVDGSTIQTVSTPISTRHPAEDTTLDYSYDNGGLVVTPTATDKPKTETTF